MDGLLVVDKPVGPTSHDVVARARRMLGERRIGHTGTLDPAASGVLPLVVGRATRLARFLSASDKSYDAIVRLGFATDTQDASGTAVGGADQAHRRPEGSWPGRDAIDRALDGFRGTFLQQPPAFSAKKVAGERSYRAARRAKRIASKDPADAGLSADPAQPAHQGLPLPVCVTTTLVDLVAIDNEMVTLRVDCSAGFYVRTLAHDLGVVLGTGAHLASLRRVRSGNLTLDDAVSLADLERGAALAASAMVPLSRMLPALLPVKLTDAGVRRAVHGRDLGPADVVTDEGSTYADAMSATGGAVFVRLMDSAGDLVAIGTPIAQSGLLHPAVVLV